LDTASGSSEFSFFSVLIRYLNAFCLAFALLSPRKAPSIPEKDCVSLAASSVVLHLLTLWLQFLHAMNLVPQPPPLPDTSPISLIEENLSHLGSMPGNNQVICPDVEYVVLSDDSEDI
jgi:hypothetical protein